MFLKRGPIEDEFLRLAKSLDEEDQKRIFTTGFFLRVVKGIRISYDPQLIPKVEDLIQGRCNFPAELTKRTDLWRSRGKARCKRSVKDGVFFCHVARHREFALMHDLPLDYRSVPGAVKEQKPPSEWRGHKVDDEPVIPAFKRTGTSTKRKKNELHTERQDQEPEQVHSDSIEFESAVARITKVLCRRAAHADIAAGTDTDTDTQTQPQLTAEVGTERTNGPQCVFIDPLSGTSCKAPGIFEDAEQPFCFFCPLHISVPDELLHRAKEGHNWRLYQDLTHIIELDAKLNQLGQNEPILRKQIGLQRFILASNNGIGSHPSIIEDTLS